MFAWTRVLKGTKILRGRHYRISYGTGFIVCHVSLNTNLKKYKSQIVKYLFYYNIHWHALCQWGFVEPTACWLLEKGLHLLILQEYLVWVGAGVSWSNKIQNRLSGKRNKATCIFTKLKLKWIFLKKNPKQQRKYIAKHIAV